MIDHAFVQESSSAARLLLARLEHSQNDELHLHLNSFPHLSSISIQDFNAFRRKYVPSIDMTWHQYVFEILQKNAE
jgi:hypothetical protein